VCKRLKEHAEKKDIEVYHIDLDKIAHAILENLEEPAYKETRKEISDYFGPEVNLPDGRINRKKLGDIVFNDAEKLSKLNGKHMALQIRAMALLLLVPLTIILMNQLQLVPNSCHQAKKMSVPESPFVQLLPTQMA